MLKLTSRLMRTVWNRYIREAIFGGVVPESGRLMPWRELDDFVRRHLHGCASAKLRKAGWARLCALRIDLPCSAVYSTTSLAVR
jgi:hypothetical protein